MILTRCRLTVLLGDVNILDDTDNGSVQTRRVRETRTHPMFKHPQFYYDVAVLTLDRPVVFNEKTAPICLPDKPSSFVDRYAGDLVTLTGGIQKCSQIIIIQYSTY